MIAGIIAALSAAFIALLYSFKKKDDRIVELKQQVKAEEIKTKRVEVTNEAHSMSDDQLGDGIRQAIAEHNSPKK